MCSTEYGGFQLEPDFDRTQLRTLLENFKASVRRRGEGSKKTDDRRLAFELEGQLLNREPPMVERKTLLRLAKWCHTDGHLYSEGMAVAREISRLLFGGVLDRERLGV